MFTSPPIPDGFFTTLFVLAGIGILASIGATLWTHRACEARMSRKARRRPSWKKPRRIPARVRKLLAFVRDAERRTLAYLHGAEG